jgi:FtsP/CotA-like multicopper oxidase with cupredoxin domain
LGREGVTHAGYVDDGWKDTVLVMPGERAKILMRYSDYTGLFLYHCHNLEHEDGGMMRNFAIDA